MLEFHLKKAVQPLTGAWQRLPIAPRRSTLLGLSFRPLQAQAFSLDPRDALQQLLAYPFQILRLGAYWKRIEPEPGVFDPQELDRQIDAAEQAGKQIILCVGPLKTFGYPEFFVPAHRLRRPFPEHTLIQPAAYPALLTAAADFLTRLVERYKARQSILAWQLEHEAIDPLGVEHSWRLRADFVGQEVGALRRADPTRPVLLNGYLPTSWLVRLSQGWQTRDQGDSLALAQRLADWVGVDYYARHALLTLGAKTLYLDGSQSRWQLRKRRQLLEWAAAHGRTLLVTEGQAEPWEMVTTPPNPLTQAMYSCPPEQVIANYNTWMSCSAPGASLCAYLFWGAEYWLLRQRSGDSSYLQAFGRILENA
ncbi:MAG TPA: beta-galactosidase [Anaerolineaceae bacterium]|jgi:hypothetical protein